MVTRGDSNQPSVDWEDKEAKKRGPTEAQKRLIVAEFDVEMEKGIKKREMIVLELSERYGVNRRTIERYIKKVREAEGQYPPHINKLRALLYRWIDQIRWPEARDLPLDWGTPGQYCLGNFCWEVFEEKLSYDPLPKVHRVEIYCEVEDNQLFGSIRKHLKDDMVWPMYGEFRAKGGEYWYAGNIAKDHESAQDEIYHHMREICEELTAELTKLKPRIVNRLTEILDMKKFPGSCSRCSQS